MPSSGIEPVQRTIALFSGRVQGVGFRYTCRNIALQYNVVGYVRNLPDGRVEVVIEGPHEQMDELLEAVQQRMAGFVKKVDLHTEAATGEFQQFGIRC
jgi:acylphosphatase